MGMSKNEEIIARFHQNSVNEKAKFLFKQRGIKICRQSDYETFEKKRKIIIRINQRLKIKSRIKGMKMMAD
jgi:hypothetical protein